MQSLLNSIKYTSSIEPEDIRKNLKMKTVLKFGEELEKDPKNDNGKRLTKSQICKKIGISDSSLKRNMKDLNMKSFYRHDVPVNKKKPKTHRKKKENTEISEEESTEEVS
jgi:Zn-dependent peptidase ImmA (M78 family)